MVYPNLGSTDQADFNSALNLGPKIFGESSSYLSDTNSNVDASPRFKDPNDQSSFLKASLTDYIAGANPLPKHQAPKSLQVMIHSLAASINDSRNSNPILDPVSRGNTNITDKSGPKKNQKKRKLKTDGHRTNESTKKIPDKPKANDASGNNPGVKKSKPSQAQQPSLPSQGYETVTGDKPPKATLPPPALRNLAQHAADRATFKIYHRIENPIPTTTTRQQYDSLTQQQKIEDEIQKGYNSTTEVNENIKNLSAGVNYVEEITIQGGSGDEGVVNYEVSFIKKEADSDQQIRQVALAGSLGKRFKSANIVSGTRIAEKTALTGYVKDLKVGVEAHQQLDVKSEATQHTALASLSLQFVDLHPNNIGINQNNELVLFDTDLLILESNLDYFLNGKQVSPLGQNFLQTLDIPIDEAVFDHHLESLREVVGSELPGANLGLSHDQGINIYATLLKYLANDESLTLHSKVNSLFAISNINNVDDTEVNIDTIKREFTDLLRQNPHIKEAISNELLQKGIPKSVVDKFRRNPVSLHPKNTTLKQLNALIDRAANLTNLQSLRRTFLNPQTNQNDKIQTVKDCILGLPSDTATKEAVLIALNGRPDQQSMALDTVDQLVSGRLSFNKIARSAYPAISVLYSLFRYSSELDYDLRAENAPAYQQTLINEAKRYVAFAKSL